jgi:glycosyltransferase involved in cell wall biosynthesis
MSASAGGDPQALSMNILHVVALVHASTGGPAFSVTRLASEQARLGHKVTLATLRYEHLGPEVEAPGVRVLALPGNLLAVHGRGWSPELARMLRREAKGADLVHNHGLWMWPNAYARAAAVAAGVPLVVSPRGMLDGWSLKRSRVKKTVAWWLFEKRNLNSAALFHATSDLEVRNIRARGLEQEIVVAPNGVDCPDLAARPGRQALEHKFPVLRGRKWIVFLSRLHPKKGLDVLLGAWSRQARRDQGVLVLAGSDLIGYGRELEHLIAQLGVQDSVCLPGEMRGAEKDALMANAEVFVLPSYSENFGLAIAEAMAWARPVIASTATPWSEIAERGAGWWVPPEIGAVAGALQEALSSSREKLQAMGCAGRALVERNYTWPAAARAVTHAYARVLAD